MIGYFGEENVGFFGDTTFWDSGFGRMTQELDRDTHTCKDMNALKNTLLHEKRRHIDRKTTKQEDKNVIISDIFDN